MNPAFLIVGGDSMVARALAGELARRGIEHHASTRRSADVSPERPFVDLANGNWDQALRGSYRWVIICAAIARIEACAQDPETAQRVNADNMVALAHALADRGSSVLYLSTNQVFDGRTPFIAGTAPTSPMTAYGASKAAGERKLRELVPTAAILRLSKVLEPDNALFAGWIRQLRNGATISPFADMTLAPVSQDTVTEALLSICLRADTPAGIWQLSAANELTYAEAAAYVAVQLGLTPSRIRAAATADSGLLSDPPPLHTTLDTSRLKRLGVAAPDCRRALDMIVARNRGIAGSTLE
jgi:dTDP-4-dehydrorhamnose reductase